MADIKDILGVPRAGAAPADKPAKAEKPKLVKPKGMSREAFALLSSSHPLAAADLVAATGAKKKPAAAAARARASGLVCWEWRPFTNPARADGLELHHWVKCVRDPKTGAAAPADGGAPYAHARFDTHAQVLRYSDEEWAALVAPAEGWTRAETDYLLDLCQAYDLRWMVIADRYDYRGEGGGGGAGGAAAGGAAGGAAGAGAPPPPPPRTMEDLKERYYSVARQLLVGREGGADTVANRVEVRHPFSAAHERQRKAGLELLMARRPEDAAEEDALLAAAARVEAKRRAAAAARGGGRGGAGAGGSAGAGEPAEPGAGPAAALPPPAEVAEVADAPPPGVPPLFDSRGRPAPPPGGASVAARAAHAREAAEEAIRALPSAKARAQVEQSLADLRLAELPRGATRAVCGAYLALLRELAELLEAKRAYQTRAALAAQAHAAGRGAPLPGGGLKRGPSGDADGGDAAKRARMGY